LRQRKERRDALGQDRLREEKALTEITAELDQAISLCSPVR
jgi:hypothetical protein